MSSSSKPEPRPPLTFDQPDAPLSPPESFLNATSDFGISFEQNDLDKLGSLLAFTLLANERVNLTAIKDAEAAWNTLIFDALTLLPVLDQVAEWCIDQNIADPNLPLQLADVGSGGGFPALVLATLLQPSTERNSDGVTSAGAKGWFITLVEATAKKTAYLQAAAAFLQLDNVRVVNERAEVVGKDSRHRSTYHAVTARAVGHTAMVSELTLPLAQVGGRVLLVKGERAEQELEEAKQALHALHAVHEGSIKTPTGTILVLAKPRKTPGKYPRKVGEPKRSPLGMELHRSTKNGLSTNSEPNAEPEAQADA